MEDNINDSVASTNAFVLEHSRLEPAPHVQNVLSLNSIDISLHLGYMSLSSAARLEPMGMVSCSGGWSVHAVSFRSSFQTEID